MIIEIDYPNISAYNQEEVSIAFWFKYDPSKYNNDDQQIIISKRQLSAYTNDGVILVAGDIKVLIQS